MVSMADERGWSQRARIGALICPLIASSGSDLEATSGGFVALFREMKTIWWFSCSIDDEMLIELLLHLRL